MALVAVPPFELWAPPPMSATLNSMLLDAAAEKAAMLFRPPAAGDIDRVAFRTGTVATGATVDVRLETVGADGNPTGTLFGTNTNASKVIADANDNVWLEATLTATASVTPDDPLALVIVNPAGGNLNIARWGGNGGRPYTSLFTSSWAQSPDPPVAAVRYSSGVWAFVPGMYVWDSFVNLSYASSGSPDEWGNKITVPFACRVWGLWSRYTTTPTAGDFTLKLYDNASSELASIAVDGDAGVPGSGRVDWVPFASTVDLAAGAVVRASRLATTATATGFSRVTTATGYGAALPGGGQMVATSRTDAGSWTDTADSVCMIGLLLSALDDGAGGGTTQGNLGTVLRGVAH